MSSVESFMSQPPVRPASIPQHITVRGVRIELLAVESTNIAAIGYDEAARLLAVVFRPPAPRPGQNMIYETGRVYVYKPIAHDRYAALMQAPSKGKHLHQHVVNNPDITCERLSLADVAA